MLGNPPPVLPKNSILPPATLDDAVAAIHALIAIGDKILAQDTALNAHAVTIIGQQADMIELLSKSVPKTS
jgi:hypothetical protein